MNIRFTRHTSVLLYSLVTACDPSPADEQDDPTATAGDDGDDDPDDDPAGAQRFFLPTDEPDNTSAPIVELDAQGGVHAVYPAYAGGDAFYAYCPAGCDETTEVSVVRLSTEGTTANAMLALDAEGRPRVLLSTFQYVYYASCDGDCTEPSAWTTTKILDHQGDREVTGEAFALDGQGRPRFLMHTYVAYLGIGQKAPETHYVTCDADCHDPASWSSSLVATQIWKFSHLRFDAQGRARVATVATVEGENGALDEDMGAYLECEAACDEEASWAGIGLAPAFSNDLDAVAVKPAISMALTRDGAPRIAMLGKDTEGVRNIIYFACDEDCSGDSWAGTILVDGDDIGPGIDIALDAADHPRFAYTFDYNIGLAYCDAERCDAPDSPWDLVKVELGVEMPPDEIFLWPNCNVGAWFLHSPSLALTADGAPRVGYQARDISGGWSNPDPTQPDCEAGTDMTWSRLALLPSMS